MTLVLILLIVPTILAISIALILSIVKKPKKTLSVLAVLTITLLLAYWIKEKYFTSLFDKCYSKAQSEYQAHTIWWATSCPEAVVCLDKALAAWKPADGLENKLKAISWRAELLGLDHKPEAAISDYNQAIEIDPQEWQFYEGRGNQLCASQKYDAAIADFDKALKLTNYPKSRNFLHSKHACLGPAYDYGLWLERGEAYYAKRDFSRAITDFTEEIKLAPPEMQTEPPVGHDGYVGGAYWSRAKAYNRSDQYDKAIQDFSKCLAFAVSVIDKSEAYRERGYAYMQLGKHQEAIEDFTKANEKEIPGPYRWFNFHERAIAYEALGQTDKARQDSLDADKLKLWVSGKNGKRYLPPN